MCYYLNVQLQGQKVNIRINMRMYHHTAAVDDSENDVND